jgi:hypothetical protein
LIEVIACGQPGCRQLRCHYFVDITQSSSTSRNHRQSSGTIEFIHNVFVRRQFWLIDGKPFDAGASRLTLRQQEAAAFFVQRGAAYSRLRQRFFTTRRDSV